MAVARGGRALLVLMRLMKECLPVVQVLGAPYLPERLQPTAGTSEVDEHSLVGGYGDENRYKVEAFSPRATFALHQPPAAVLHADTPPEIANAYIRASLDLTMQGGATSGVVYPLAVCELATRFKFRNIGGASAGAIAAAMTAAAELGRTSVETC